MVAENRGRNSNNVTLVCRYSEDNDTWYEFNISNGGEYWIYAHVDGFQTVANGGSTAVRQGRDTNTYAATCIGNELTLYINGVEVNSVNENIHGLSEGQVGFGVSSFDILPIEVAVSSFTIE
jgi:hypothetical protein